jgi:hypothetical protein
MDTIAMQTYPEIQIVYSNNVVCYEQSDMLGQIRTFVLIPAQGNGFVAIAKKCPGQGYCTLKRWKLDPTASVSFHLDINVSYKLDARLLPEMVTRYNKRPKDWGEVSRETRYPGIIQVPRGTTSA